MTVPLGTLHPARGFRIGCCFQRPSYNAAEIVCDHVVVSDAITAGIVVANDAIEKFDEFDGLDLQPSLFLYLANHPLVQGLADFEHATREGPLPLQGLTSAPDEQHPSLIDHYGPYANNRRLGVLTLDGF